MADGSAGPLRISQLRSQWSGFVQWWLAGLRDTLPAAWSDGFLGRAGPIVVIESGASGCLCRTLVEPQRQGLSTSARSGAEALTHYLAQAGLRRDEVTLGVLIDRPLFFTRDIDVPEAALAALPRLLDQDILRRTPFSLADILHGAAPARIPASRRGVTALRHWIIRRELVEAALQKAALGHERVDVLVARDDDGREAPVVRLGAAAKRGRPWARRALALTAGIACLGTVLAIVAMDQAQEGEAERLAAALADLRTRAHGSSGVTDAVGLLTIKADLGMAAILTELSKVMPDDTYLTELRVADGKVETAGFSGDAARLVRLVDGSSVFKGATLAGAIEPSLAEGKEHFSLTAELRTGQMLRLRPASSRPRVPAVQDPGL